MRRPSGNEKAYVSAAPAGERRLRRAADTARSPWRPSRNAWWRVYSSSCGKQRETHHLDVQLALGGREVHAQALGVPALAHRDGAALRRRVGVAEGQLEARIIEALPIGVGVRRHRAGDQLSRSAASDADAGSRPVRGCAFALRALVAVVDEVLADDEVRDGLDVLEQLPMRRLWWTVDQLPRTCAPAGSSRSAGRGCSAGTSRGSATSGAAARTRRRMPLSSRICRISPGRYQRTWPPGECQ